MVIVCGQCCHYYDVQYMQIFCRKQKVADADTAFYQKECKSMFKGHTDIITTFTSRSKTQLYLIDDDKVKSDIAKESAYGTFLKCLMTTAAQSNAIMIDAATSGIGCDEMAVIRVLCTCDSSQYFAIEKVLKTMKGNNFDIRKFIARNTSKDPNLKVLFQYLLDDLTICKRSEREEDYANNVTRETEEIFMMLQRKNEPDIDVILNKLVNSSRQHCMAIKKEFKEMFEVELVDKLPLRFSPTVVHALKLLMLPIPASVAQMLIDYKAALGKKVDGEFIFAIISRYDKDFLVEINDAYKQMSDGADMLTSYFTMYKGKLKSAVKGYFENDTPDKKVEFELNHCMEENGFGMSDMSWLSDEKMALKVRELLEQQVQNLSEHLKLKFVPIALTNKKDYATTKFEEDEEARAVEDESPAALATKKRSTMNEKRALVKQKSVRAAGPKNSGAVKEEEEKKEQEETKEENKEDGGLSAASSSGESPQQVMKRVINYLMLLFQWYDSTGVGTLDSVIFWDICTSDKLNLADFGFSPEEIECMEDLCDWEDLDADNDKSTIAYEDVVVELATNIIDCAETNGIDVVELVKARTAKLATTAPSQSNAETVAKMQPTAIGASVDAPAPEEATAVGGAAVQNGKVVPDLASYMRTTFASYDVDESGYLDIKELMQMVSAMNLGTTEDDIEALQAKWDDNGDKKISWKEAEPNLVAMITEMASDMRDHWVR